MGAHESQGWIIERHPSSNITSSNIDAEHRINATSY
jgi:hypothetical protein